MIRAIAILFLMLGLESQAKMSATPNRQNGEEDIQKVIRTLPLESSFRRKLEEGARGDGTHYPWMDEMGRYGVRRARLEVRFVWQGRPTEIKLTRATYYSKYDFDCAEITNEDSLSRIRTSGLERELGNVAIERAAHASWFSFDRGVRGSVAWGTIDLLDDGWLPHPPPLLAPKEYKSPLLDILRSESSLNRYLTSDHPGQEDLDRALMAAAVYDDSCLVRPLLRAGANPNFRDKSEGNTPLMNAVSSRSIVTVNVLLDAGARPDAEDYAGRTALSLAAGKGFEDIVQLLRNRGASR